MQKDYDMYQRRGLQLNSMLTSSRNRNSSSFTQLHALILKAVNDYTYFVFVSYFSNWDWFDLYNLIVSDTTFVFSLWTSARSPKQNSVFVLYHQHHGWSTISIMVNQHWHLKDIGMYVHGKPAS